MSRCDRIVEVWTLKHYVRRGLRNASAGALRISFLAPFHKPCHDRQLQSDQLQYHAHVAVQHFIERGAQHVARLPSPRQEGAGTVGDEQSLPHDARMLPGIPLITGSAGARERAKILDERRIRHRTSILFIIHRPMCVAEPSRRVSKDLVGLLQAPVVPRQPIRRPIELARGMRANP